MTLIVACVDDPTIIRDEHPLRGVMAKKLNTILTHTKKMTDAELLEKIEEIMKAYHDKTQRDYNDLRTKMNDIHTIHADTIHIMNSFKEFFQKTSNLFGPESAATKVAARKTSKKKPEDTIRTIEYQDVDKPTRYNAYVRLIKEDEEFPDIVVSAWRSVDPKISADPHAIDYLTFYELFVSSKKKGGKNVEANEEIEDVLTLINARFDAEKKKAKKKATDEEEKKPKKKAAKEKEEEEEEEEEEKAEKKPKKTAKK